MFIELPKFKKDKVEQLTNIVERWCFFLKHAEETTEKDLEKIAKEAPIIKQAYDELDKYHWLEKDLAVYEDRMNILQKEEGILEQKFDDGKVEGKIEGKIEVAKNLLKVGVSVDLIAESTGLSQAKIVQLKQDVQS